MMKIVSKLVFGKKNGGKQIVSYHLAFFLLITKQN